MPATDTNTPTGTPASTAAASDRSSLSAERRDLLEALDTHREFLRTTARA